MVARKTFLSNPKHQYHVSQLGEHDCSVHNKKSGNYYENSRLSHFTDEFYYKENGGKKSISCKSKASIMCIPMMRI